MAPRPPADCPAPENCPYLETIESINVRLANIEGMLSATRWIVGIVVSVSGIIAAIVVGLAGKVHVK